MTGAPLSALIRKRLTHLGYSYRYATDPHRVGDLITSGTLHRYADPQNTSLPDERTMEGIAAAIEVPIEDVWKAVGRPVHNLGPFVLPERAAGLTQKERRAVLAIVDALLAAKQRDGAG